MKALPFATVALALAFAAPVALAQTPEMQQRQPGAGAGASGTMQQSELQGLSVYGSDGDQIGQVSDVQMSGGEVQAIHVKTGTELGLGERTVEIKKDKFQKTGNRIDLQMTAAEVKDLPEAKSGAGQQR